MLCLNLKYTVPQNKLFCFSAFQQPIFFFFLTISIVFSLPWHSITHPPVLPSGSLSFAVTSRRCLCAPLTATVPPTPRWQSYTPKGSCVTAAAALADHLPPVSFTIKYVGALAPLFHLKTWKIDMRRCNGQFSAKKSPLKIKGIFKIYNYTIWTQMQKAKKTKCQSRHLRKSTQFTSGRTLLTYFFFFLVWRSPAALQQAPTIPSIAGSVCTVATVSQTRQALMLKEV